MWRPRCSWWGTIERFRRRPYSESTGSSQFLENRRHFWTVVLFHYGIIAVLLSHIIAVALLHAIAAWHTESLRLYLLEGSGLVFGPLAVIGFAVQEWSDEDPVTGSAHRRLAHFSSERLGKDESLAHQVSRRGGALRARLNRGRVLLG